MDLKVLLLLFGLLTVATCQDWCTMQGCATNSHIACNHNGQFHSRCISPRAITFSAAQRNLILDTFNRNRNQIAAGGFRVFLPARRMARVTWNDQLAWLASLNVRSCQMQFHSRCVNPRELSLTSTQKNLILDTFNQKRNQIAAGGFGVFLPAKRMARVTWNDQLAWLASLNVRSCQMAHDSCRNTPDFRWAGQNLGAFARTGSFHTTEDVINTVIKMWSDEYQYTLMSDINKFESGAPRGQVIGHFTAMVTDRTTQIGCAISQYETVSGSTRWLYSLMACNFANTNILSCPVYRSGTRAQECTLGADPQFPGLCRANEPIDPNQLIC
ncbi:CLUMA_CG017107, isoform A [Clunio marinus]|uniref:CLUMA_CG017107, isoform A n=1 Tax=Clunio marinus TaxID=568069 RepID=A0A1J1IWP7_9DIPT|nr:CLUMA_CG017107, isoform A [Clunio marinus]